jgi:alpha-beta hydrolase superfamily lysophospholipase
LCVHSYASTSPITPLNTTLKTSDGVTVFALEYKAVDPRAVILLFHQAGSNKGEYSTIAPRLVHEGFTVLAIDQRSGGSLFGQHNDTVKKLGKSSTYLETMPDLEAALAWGSQQKLPVLVWGSSYSSSLVFLLASKHQEKITAVLAFSPGEYLGQEGMVQQAAAKVTQPIFVTSSIDIKEIDAAKKIIDASPSISKVQFVPKIAGVHGSSTLRDEKNSKGKDENWQAVLAFLKSLKF